VGGGVSLVPQGGSGTLGSGGLITSAGSPEKGFYPQDLLKGAPESLFIIQGSFSILIASLSFLLHHHIQIIHITVEVNNLLEGKGLSRGVVGVPSPTYPYPWNRLFTSTLAVPRWSKFWQERIFFINFYFYIK
jgi:hypothetical protein